MKLLSRQFRLAKDEDREPLYVSANRHLKLCAEATPTILQRFFNLPRTPKVLWLSLHDLAGKDRKPFTVGWYNEQLGWTALKHALGEITDYPETMDELLLPLIGRTVWLEVEYEELE